MLKANTNGVALHYQQHGAGTDVILVHGITSNLSFWLLTVLPKLAEQHRVVAYDLRGHGYSDVPATGYTSGDMADDLLGLMDDLGIARAHVVGHSFGGVVALHLAARYPARVRSVVLADAAFPALRHLQSIADWPLYPQYREQLLTYGVRLPDDPDRWDLSYLVPEMAKLPSRNGLRRGLPRHYGRIDRLAAQTTMFQDFHVLDDLTEDGICAVETPTLAIYGELSPFLPTCHFLVARLPDCRSVILTGGDHFLPALAPATFAEPALEHFAVVDAGLAGRLVGPA